jgi:hypothetical protein
MKAEKLKSFGHVVVLLPFDLTISLAHWMMSNASTVGNALFLTPCWIMAWQIAKVSSLRIDSSIDGTENRRPFCACACLTGRKTLTLVEQDTEGKSVAKTGGTTDRTMQRIRAYFIMLPVSKACTILDGLSLVSMCWLFVLFVVID